MLEYRVAKSKFEADANYPASYLHETRHPELEAKFAMALIERWGMVAGIEDGEDSAGRAKIRLISSKEVVERAVDVTSRAMAEFEARGWLKHLPTMEQMEREVAQRKKETEKA